LGTWGGGEVSSFGRVVDIMAIYELWLQKLNRR
jgi:hypothetical protein